METQIYRRVLFVAPDDQSLKVLPELDTLYGLGYDVVTLQGTVNAERLWAASDHRQFDVLHVAAHGLLLPNGQPAMALTSEVLGFPGIQQVARLSGARLVVLNECGSASMAQRLVNGGLPCSIGTFDDVTDSDAKQGGMSFYRELTRSNDPHAAYMAAFSGEHYGFFSNGGYAATLQLPVLSRLDTVDQRINRLMSQSYGMIAAGVLMAIAQIAHALWRG
jgi:CHAT domain